MADLQERDLERAAATGDPDAIAALHRARERAQAQCAHMIQSKRLWLDKYTRSMRYDLFCLTCGVNMEFTPNRETLTFDDCDPSRKKLRELAEEEDARIEESSFQQKERRRKECARVAADLRTEHEWLADVEDDDDVISRYHDALNEDGSLGDW